MTTKSDLPATTATGSVKRMRPRPTKEESASFQSRLKFLREAKGWGTNELGNASGLGGGTVSRLETGSRGKRPQAITVLQLAAALEALPKWLLTGQTDDGRIYLDDPLPGQPSVAARARLDAIERRTAELERRLGTDRHEQMPESNTARKRPSGGHKLP